MYKILIADAKKQVREMLRVSFREKDYEIIRNPKDKSNNNQNKNNDNNTDINSYFCLKNINLIKSIKYVFPIKALNLSAKL